MQKGWGKTDGDQSSFPPTAELLLALSHLYKVGGEGKDVLKFDTDNRAFQ